MGFEPTRAEHNGLAVHRLNHSATSSYGDGMRRNGLLTDFYRLTIINKILIVYLMVQWCSGYYVYEQVRMDRLE